MPSFIKLRRQEARLTSVRLDIAEYPLRGAGGATVPIRSAPVKPGAVDLPPLFQFAPPTPQLP